jgi:DNA-binding MarR family transcriptional regulator
MSSTKPPPDGLPPTAQPPAFYSASNLRPQDNVGLLIKRLMQSLVLQIDRKLAAHDLTHAQWLPLHKLAHGECDTMAALAREQALDPGAMTRALDRLEAKGLLRRVRSLQDRRVVHLELTDEGRRQAAVVPPVLAEVLNAHLVGFSHDEWRLFINFLQRAGANGDALRDAPKDAP